MRFISEYGRWYCEDCKQYLPDEAPDALSKPSPPPPPAQRRVEATPPPRARPTAGAAPARAATRAPARAPSRTSPPSQRPAQKTTPKKKSRKGAVTAVLALLLVGSLFFSWPYVEPLLAGEKSIEEVVDPVSNLILSSLGGSLSLSDETKLEIPAHSLPQDTNISMAKTDNYGTISSQNTLASQVYELGPEGTTFSSDHKPTLTIPYDESQIPAGVLEDNLGLYQQGKDGKWTKVPGSQVSPSNNKVSGKISHFSKYAVMIGPKPDRSVMVDIHSLLDPATEARTYNQGSTSAKVQNIYGTLIDQEFYSRGLQQNIQVASSCASGSREDPGYFALDTAQSINISNHGSTGMVMAKMDGPQGLGNIIETVESWEETDGMDGIFPGSIELEQGYYKFTCMSSNAYESEVRVEFSGSVEFGGKAIIIHNGVAQPIDPNNLFDDGLHEDGGANDGIWAFEGIIVLSGGINAISVRSHDTGANVIGESYPFTVNASIPLTDVRIMLTWDSDMDLDLHVRDPEGRTAYWNNKLAITPGGALDVDDRDGYGPETFTLIHAAVGTYNITVALYGASEVNPPSDSNATIVLELAGQDRIIKTHLFRSHEIGVIWYVTDFDIE